MNKVTLIGTITRNPEFRNANGLDILEMTVAGERQADGKTLAFYSRVNVVGKRAASLQGVGLEQGTPVLVEGTLEQNAWETESGEKRSTLRVKGLNVQQLTGDFSTEEDQGGGVRMKGGRNLVQLTGNLGQDVELRETENGPVADLRVAVNESWINKDGERQEKTHWITVTVWRELAERAESLRKGSPVYVEGALTSDSWTDKNGDKRSSQKVEATDLQALMRVSSTANASAQPEVVDAPQADGGKGKGRKKVAADAPEDGDMPF